jgi:hypothetical protein
MEQSITMFTGAHPWIHPKSYESSLHHNLSYKMHDNISLPSTSRSPELSFLVSQLKFCLHFTSVMRAMRPALFIALYMIIVMKYNTEWPQIKVQFKKLLFFFAVHILENELIHNSGPAFWFHPCVIDVAFMADGTHVPSECNVVSYRILTDTHCQIANSVSQFWDYVKDKIYVPPPTHSLRELPDRIREAVMSVDEDTLSRVWGEITITWGLCPITRGSHIEHLRTKTWMLGHCCRAISFPICDLNKKL